MKGIHVCHKTNKITYFRFAVERIKNFTWGNMPPYENNENKRIWFIHSYILSI
jgi:hypothetical protein